MPSRIKVREAEIAAKARSASNDVAVVEKARPAPPPRFSPAQAAKEENKINALDPHGGR